MANFEQAHKIVMAHEGGYANDPDDNGGETYKGISRKNFPKWLGWVIVDVVKNETKKNAHFFAVPIDALNNALSQDEKLQYAVHSFYKNTFWDALSLDQVNNQAIALELYDTAVNMGIGRASEFLQVALNVSNNNGKAYPDLLEDYKIGSKTINCLNAHSSPSLILKLLNVQQGAKYIDIMRANKTQEKYLKGWFNRVAI